MPQSIKIHVDGEFPPGVAPKDLILKIIGDLKADGADYQSVEFHGPGIEKMSIAGRMTLCNMGIEMGAKNAVCRPDEKAIAHVRARGKRSDWEVIWADAAAEYTKVLNYNLSELVPAVAKPHQVDNYAPVTDVLGRKIDQAFIGTCTNARLEDLRIAAEILRGGRVKALCARGVSAIIAVSFARIYFRNALNEGLPVIGGEWNHFL